jgi:predicted dehydrogenase
MKKTQLNWGFLGAAKIGRSLAPAIVASRYARAYAVASRAREKAETYARENGFERSYGSYQALLKDPNVDVIYNPLPNHLHCEWTIRALEAGKHVLCEKPLALNVAECRRMIAAAKRNRRLLMEAFMYRLHPQTLRLQELIQKGAIGEVRVIRAGFGFSLNESARNVRLGKRMGGGCLMDVGCYCVNAMRTFFRDEPEQVAGQARRGRISGVDMTFGGVLMFSQGRFGVFTSSFQTILDWGVEIVGTLGRISVPSPWKPDGRLASFVMEAHGKRTVVQIKNGGGIYHCEVDHFSRCILEGKPLAMPPDEGLKNMRVIEALYNSARRGKAVRVKA